MMAELFSAPKAARQSRSINKLITRRPLVALSALVGAVGASAAQGVVIDLGIADSAATDQPRVTVLVAEPPATPGGDETYIGPGFFDQFILDTGANGLLFAEAAYFESEPFVPAQRGDGS